MPQAVEEERRTFGSLFGRKPKRKRGLYVDYDNVLYALPYKLNPSTPEETILDNNFSYFLMSTKIKSGSDTGEKIRNVIFELEFKTLQGQSQSIEIEEVRPGLEISTGGTTSHMETIKIEKGGNVHGEANLDANLGFVKAKVGGGGKLDYDKSKVTVNKFEYPKSVTLAQGGGAGTHANWEFIEDESKPFDHQRSLSILFKIRKPHSTLKGKGTYQAVPRALANNRLLNLDENGQPLKPLDVDFLT
jgi:hypothetical protein